VGDALWTALNNMRILVISDVHANLNALNAVLEDAGRVDATWCLGDLVGYGPDPNECIEKIRAIENLTCMLGNHDAAALDQIPLEVFNQEARQSAKWTKNKLKPDSLDYLKSLPTLKEESGVTLAHGSPRNPVWEYLLDTWTASLSFSAFTTQFAFVGHSHLPLAYFQYDNTQDIDWTLLKGGDTLKLESRAILNPGSVGQPRDQDPRASYAIFNPEQKLWRLYRVEYDFSTVQKRIAKAGLPRRHAQRLSEGI
jgi:predicted phosphodiesterase